MVSSACSPSVAPGVAGVAWPAESDSMRMRSPTCSSYELQVGDRIRIESLSAGHATPATPGATEGEQAEDTITRELIVQPDGTITLPLLGQVRATRRTISALHDELEEA